ncbi:MAG TPA: Gfo/Idh/MocA family oxidoreductase [Candidatus Acidoferrum sp.]
MQNPNRRSFLIASGLTALASTRILGANDTLRIGLIGAGGRMGGLLKAADQLGQPYQIVAVSDAYAPRCDAVKARSNGIATTHADYREVLQQQVDAVIIASPDHWHVRMAVDALAAGKDVYLEKPVTHTIEEGATLVHAVRSSKQILQCGMQQRSWSHFRDAVDLIQGGSLGRVPQVRTYWWQNYHFFMTPKPVDNQALDWKQWLGGAPDQSFTEEKFYRWRWFWSFGGGAMTDLFSHWIDVVHWAMKSDQPRQAQMLGDRFMFEQWECPDTVQAALRYPGFDVVYEGMMASSIDDGGLEFRGTEATLKLNRGGFTVYHENAQPKDVPVVKADSFRDGTIDHIQNFFDCVRTRKEPNAPVETGVAAARAGHIANLAYRGTGQISWPPKP